MTAPNMFTQHDLQAMAEHCWAKLPVIRYIRGSGRRTGGWDGGLT